MFYVIKNNQLNEWADALDALDFKGEAKELRGVSTREFEPEKYRVKDGVLTDISHTEEYQDELKEARREMVEKECILTSAGYLRRQTKAGDLLSVFNTYSNFVQLENRLPAGVLLIYDQEGNSSFNNEMSFDEFSSLFKEVANAYLANFRGEE